jgi:uncharacterized protein
VVEALRHPRAYPHPVERVTVLVDDVSVVFRAGNFVLQAEEATSPSWTCLGSPTRSTSVRRSGSTAASDLYLGVVSITDSATGIRVGGEGAPLEYAVHMRRLPEERMMDRLLRQRTLGRP